MINKIVSISFLYDGERIRIGADDKGKFPLPKIRKNRTPTQSISYMHPHTAKEFIEHKKIKHNDPVLTLSDGTKMRVYQGGDPTGLLIEAISIIETHDDSYRARRKLITDRLRKKNKEKISKTTDTMMGFDYGYYYPDEDEDVD